MVTPGLASEAVQSLGFVLWGGERFQGGEQCAQTFPIESAGHGWALGWGGVGVENHGVGA